MLFVEPSCAASVLQLHHVHVSYTLSVTLPQGSIAWSKKYQLPWHLWASSADRQANDVSSASFRPSMRTFERSHFGGSVLLLPFVGFLWDSHLFGFNLLSQTRVSSGAAGTQAMWCVIWRPSLCLQPLNIAPWCHGGFYPLPFSLCCCVICQLICPCQLSEWGRGRAGCCQIFLLTCVISQLTVTQPGPQWNSCFLYLITIDFSIFLVSFF